MLQEACGFKPVLHMHNTIDESFSVLEGELTYVLHGKKGTVKKGEMITFPKGFPDTHYSDSPQDLRRTCSYQCSIPSFSSEQK
jgi:uncharacterized cupin superfamily protein